MQRDRAQPDAALLEKPTSRQMLLIFRERLLDVVLSIHNTRKQLVTIREFIDRSGLFLRDRFIEI